MDVSEELFQDDQSFQLIKSIWFLFDVCLKLWLWTAGVLIYSLKSLCLHLFILMTDGQERLLMPVGECSDYLIQLRPTAANNSICFPFLVENKTFKHQLDSCVTLMTFLRCSDTERSCDELVTVWVFVFFFFWSYLAAVTCVAVDVERSEQGH